MRESQPIIFIDKRWWRRRESNPRPWTFRTGVYIHILKFGFRLVKSPPGKMLDRLSRKNITDPLTGYQDRLSC